MQRDLKVGLSLGVLVLGVVGALLFRKEQASETPKPTLKTARKIDERIAERPRTPYMTGDVEFDQDDSDNPNEKADQVADGRPAHTVPPDWMNDDEDPFQVTRNDQGRFDFRHGADAADTVIEPVQPTSPSKSRESATLQAGVQTHVIQSGDSLSLLAERYLGSQGRFQEIYDANRDVLTDVNRLPLGATIVIPSTAKASPKRQTEATARAAMSQPERVRGTITDISTIEPIAPPPVADTKAEDKQASGGNEPKPADAAAPKTREAKKFVTPSRLPFANQNHSAASNPSRSKPLDPEGEEFAPAKSTTKNDEANGAAGETRHYQVRKGDSLEKIATRIYGNPKRAADIFAANRSLLTSPNAVREGQELVLPE